MSEENKVGLEDREEEIFKTLSHKIRREIIKFIGTEGKLLFSEIQSKIGSIDSSSLSYHLKNLNPLITQKAGKYVLTETGLAAFNLLAKTDESVRISKYKKKFTYAQIATIICWIVASSIIPVVMNFSTDFLTELILFQIIIAIMTTVNSTIIGILRSKY